MVYQVLFYEKQLLSKNYTDSLLKSCNVISCHSCHCICLTVAERVLARKTLDFKKSQMIVSRLEKPRWDKRTVLVTGFAMMNEEMLELLYENKKKSGGGPIECITMLEGNSAALVTFMNEAGIK